MNLHMLTNEQTNRIRQDIAYLSGPETQGRMSASPGAKKAAEYLKNQLKVWGYETAC